MSPTELSSSEAERLRAFERQGHDGLAKSYHAFFSAVTALATNPLLDVVRLQPGTRLLDVASGPGALTAEAANRGARSVGVDLSPRMIELAQQLYPAIEFREADAEHLPFPDHAFDAVVCAFGLGHFPKPELAVAECVRTLSPGGCIAFAWWHDPARQRIQGIFREAIAEIGVSVGRAAGPQCVSFLQLGRIPSVVGGSWTHGSCGHGVRCDLLCLLYGDSLARWIGQSRSDRCSHQASRSGDSRLDPKRVRTLRQRLQISRWIEPACRILDRLRPAADLMGGTSFEVGYGPVICRLSAGSKSCQHTRKQTSELSSVMSALGPEAGNTNNNRLCSFLVTRCFNVPM
jgi:SAM-dependent methyltransferase